MRYRLAPGGWLTPRWAMRLLIVACSWLPAPAWSQPATTMADDATTSAATEPEAPSLPDDTHLRVDLSPNEITVGDPVRATLILEWPAGAPDVDPRFPAWQDTWGTAEVLEIGPVERARGTRGQTLFTQTITLTAFRTGDIDLPGVTIALPLGETTAELETPDDLRLTVTSVLPEGEDAPAPVAAVEPLALPIGARFWWTTGILATLCVITALAVARRHPTAFGGLLAAPRLPPFDELMARLEALGPTPTSERAHTQISLALRTYLGRATGVQAVERTTSEIRRLLRNGPLPPDVVQRIVTMMQRCDEAKFIGGLEVPDETIRLRRTEAEAIARVIDESQRAETDEEEPGSTPKTPRSTVTGPSAGAIGS